MANLQFSKTHNQVAHSVKTEEGDGPKFYEVIDFINNSFIRYALTIYPTLYSSQINQFWHTATALTLDEDDQDIPIPALSATMDGQTIYVTDKSLRRHL
jgi:hypothetical protein